MSQPDVLTDLRTTRPAAPAELRERVRAIAATAAPPPRRLTWRRAALVLVPAVLAVAVGAAVVGRDRGAPTADRAGTVRSTPNGGGLQKGATRAAAPLSTLAPAPSATRPQDYDATLRLRVASADALSDATKRAVRVAASLGGFASVVSVDVHGPRGDALLRLRVPVAKVQAALERLSALGTITGESVQVHDVQPQLAAGERRIARLQRQLRALRADPGTPPRRLAALTAQIERLQRARAATIRQARLATIRLELQTPAPAPQRHAHGALHGALAALRWLGIVALYALIVGGPVVAVLAALWLGRRFVRRRAAERLLDGSG
jgi:hypothetical protein